MEPYARIELLAAACFAFIAGCGHQPPLDPQKAIPVDRLIQDDMRARTRLIHAELTQDHNIAPERTIEIGKVRMVTSADVPHDSSDFCMGSVMGLMLCMAGSPFIQLARVGAVAGLVITAPVWAPFALAAESGATPASPGTHDDHHQKSRPLESNSGSETKSGPTSSDVTAREPANAAIAESERKPLGARYSAWSAGAHLEENLLSELDQEYVSAFRRALGWPALTAEQVEFRPEPLLPAMAVGDPAWVWLGISQVVLLDLPDRRQSIILCARSLIQYNRPDDLVNRHFETCVNKPLSAAVKPGETHDVLRLRALLFELASQLAAAQVKALTGESSIVPIY